MSTKNIVTVRTLEEWKDLPFSYKYDFKWFFPFLIYKRPYALKWSEWEKFYSLIKEEHPVQFFFRETLSIYYYSYKQKLQTLNYKIKYFFVNPRKEMRKAVFPSTYQDLPTIIENFHIEVIKEFVEREKCFEYNCYDGPQGKKLKKELNKYYKYITEERKEMLDNLSNVNYKSYSLTSKKLAKKDSELAIWVIKNKNSLWT